MELHQLAYLVAVAEERSFTRAGAREHVAQPGVSAQIRKLEAELGQPLFDRGGGEVRLTAAGQAALPHARAALAGAAAVRTAVDELVGLVRGHVLIGAVAPIGDWFIDSLASFHLAHPTVEVSLVEGRSSELLDGVASGRFEIVVAGLVGDTPAGCGSEVVADDALVAAVAPGHPLAARHRITIAKLAEHPLIALPPGTGARSALESGFAAAGRRANVALEAGDPRVLLEFAARGLGVAVLPASAAGRLHTLAIRPELRSRLELVWREEPILSPAGAALVGSLRGALARRADRD